MRDRHDNPDPAAKAHERATAYSVIAATDTMRAVFKQLGYVEDGTAYLRRTAGHGVALVHMADTKHGRVITIDVFERPEVPGSGRASATVPSRTTAIDLDNYATFCFTMWGAI